MPSSAWTQIIPNTLVRAGQKIVTTQSVPWTANVATDYRFRAGPMRRLRLGLGVNMRGPRFIGNRGGDTIRDPNNPAVAMDDPKSDAISWVKAKGYYARTGTMSYTLRFNESRRPIPKTAQFDLSIDNLLGRNAPIFGSTQGSHNTNDTNYVPNDGTFDDPSRHSLPGNFTLLNPRNFTLSARMDF